MKFLRILLVSLLALVVIFVSAAFILPTVYKEDLLALAKKEAAKSLRADTDFNDLDISLFRDFPRISVQLTQLAITGREEFSGVPLLRCDAAELSVSLWDLLDGDDQFDILHFNLTKPQIQVLVLENGLANYDITIPDTALEEPSAIRGAIRRYAIQEGSILYEDRSMPVFMRMVGLDHQGTGDFSAAQFDLVTSTRVDSMTLAYDGTTFLDNARITLDVELGMDMEKMKFTFKENDLTINELPILGEGSFELPAEDIAIDLHLYSPTTDFRQLWSVLPGAYTSDYSKMVASGTYTLDVIVKGIVGETTIPSFTITSKVDKGKVQYPGFPLPIEAIGLDLKVSQPSTTLDALAIQIPRFAFRIGDRGIQGEFEAKDVMTDPLVKGAIQGSLDLQTLGQAFPLGSVRNQGIIDIQLQANARMSDIDAGNYDKVDLTGTLGLQDIVYQAVDMPEIGIRSGSVRFSPQFAEAKDLLISAGRSDMLLQARIDNILAVIHPERTLKGKVTLRSSLLDLDEWASSSSEDQGVSSLPQDSSSVSAGLPTEQFDLSMDAAIRELKASGKEVKDLRIVGTAGPRTLKAQEISGKMGNSDFRLDGQVENLFGWMTGQDILKGTFNFSSSFLDLNALMPTSEGTTNQESTFSPIPIPADIQVRANAKVARLRYADMDLRNLSSQVAIGNRIALLEELRADGLGGKMAMTGAYNAQQPNNPTFNIKYDLQQLDFRQVFEKFNTFRTLAPIGQYLQGRFNTSLVMEGTLDSTLTPIWSSLDAAGFLETFNAVIQGAKPLEGLADKLNIAELRNLTIPGSKNWFEVRDGVVELKEFDQKVKDIDLKIGGKHTLGQGMDFLVKARVPRKYLDKAGAGIGADKGVRWLESEAARKGIKFSVGEFVNLAIGIGGTMAAPTYSLKVLGTEGAGGTSLGGQLEAQAGAMATQVKDSLERLARQKATEVGQEVKEQAEAKLDTLKGQAQAKVDSALQKAKDEAAKKIGDEATKKIEEIGGEKAKQEAEKIKDKMKQWNPLKKKEGQ